MNEKRKELNRKIGLRLLECRNLRGLSQKELEIKLTSNLEVSGQRISNYENGKRTIDNETLVTLADILHVNSDYLACKSDTIQPSYIDNEDDIFFKSDYHFIMLLENLGYKVQFNVIKIYEDNKTALSVNVNSFVDFTLSNSKQILRNNDNSQSEVVIISVFVNGYEVSVGFFMFTIENFYRQIKAQFERSALEYSFVSFRDYTMMNSNIADLIENTPQHGVSEFDTKNNISNRFFENLEKIKDAD